MDAVLKLGKSYFKQMVAQGMEGIVIKPFVPTIGVVPDEGEEPWLSDYYLWI